MVYIVADKIPYSIYSDGNTLQEETCSVCVFCGFKQEVFILKKFHECEVS